MANFIRHVSITKLWGIKNISTALNEHVNIFIGSNGTSKTTFLTLIEAVLLCDIETLTDIEFESIEIILEEDSWVTIKVTKINSEDIPKVRYEFNEKQIETMCTDPSYRPYRYSTRNREALLAIKTELAKYVNISWLSINRDNTSFTDREIRNDFERIRNMVDLKLQELVKKLIVYQLQLESEANKSANKFKEECLSLMLYNEHVDAFNTANINLIANTNTTSMKQNLSQAFKALGVEKDKRDQINIHISKIKDVITKIESKDELDQNDIIVVSLINRTLSIIDISKDHESQIKKIFAPIENLWECLKGFMPNKDFELNKENDGNIIIQLTEDRDKPTSIGITSLSSGEKQLFILLVEALLQKGTPHIFIADEPELSLHIAWQRKIIEAILNLNPNAQIIVATHSPEVAAHHRTNLINMKAITSYV